MKTGVACVHSIRQSIEEMGILPLARSMAKEGIILDVPFPGYCPGRLPYLDVGAHVRSSGLTGYDGGFRFWQIYSLTTNMSWYSIEQH